jgi:hypothetical protein
MAGIFFFAGKIDQDIPRPLFPCLLFQSIFCYFYKRYLSDSQPNHFCLMKQPYHFLKRLFFVLLLASTFAPLQAQLQIQLPPHSTVYAGIYARGYWFTAPTNFIITGLMVAPEAGTGQQYIHVMKCHDPFPVATTGSSNFTTLAYISGGAYNTIQPVNIPIQQGDVICILGTATGIANSYAASGVVTTTIAGYSVYLDRAGYQGSIETGPAATYWGEGQATTGQIGRIHMWYALSFAPDDAGIMAIDQPTSPASPGLNSVSAVLRNYGTDTLYSAVINWSVDGVSQTAVPWTGSQLYPDSSVSVSLGSYNFPIGAHEIKAWSTLPNGVADTVNYNDTATTTIQVCNLLSGNFTIGASGADYSSFSAAVSAISACGISGPVSFSVLPGTYNEQFTIPEIPGTSSTNTVTFQSSTGNADDVIVSFTASSTNNWTVNLDGADYVTLQDLTFEANDGTYARTVVIQNGANYNSIIDCKIISNPLARSNSNSTGIYDASGNDNYNVITGNLIQNGYYGIYSYGSSTSSLEEGWIVENNVVEDYYYYGIRLYYHLAPKVNGNVVRNHSSSGIVYGLSCAYCDEGLEIQNNVVEATGSSTQYALYVYYCDASPGNEGLVANNMVSITSLGTGTHYGTYWYYNNYQRYYHNSLHLVSGSSTSRAAYIYLSLIHI